MPKFACRPLRDHLNVVLVLRIENEHRAHGLVRRIDLALRIHPHSVGTNQLEGDVCRASPGRRAALPPDGPSRSACRFCVAVEAGVDLLACIHFLERDPRDRRRVRPYDLGDIEIARVRAFAASTAGAESAFFLPACSVNGAERATTEPDQPQGAPQPTGLPRHLTGRALAPRPQCPVPDSVEPRSSTCHFPPIRTSIKSSRIDVAGFAELHVVLLVFHQHPRLVSRSAADDR